MNTEKELGNNNKEPESKEIEQNPWYEYNNIANNENLNETIVTLRLTKKHYKTVYTLAHMLGFKSLDDYISNIVVHNIEMEITGGDINYDREKLF
jgi:hypothetical protein